MGKDGGTDVGQASVDEFLGSIQVPEYIHVHICTPQ